MSTTKTSAQVPKLRFPGFEGEWRSTELGEVADLYQPQTISQAELTKDGFPVYGANGVIGFYHRYNHEHEQVAVTCRGSTCGVVNLTSPKSWITGNAMVVNLDNRPRAAKRFVYQSLKAADLRYLITGSGQPQITGVLKDHEIGLPTLPEQQKIAAFLTAVDGRIEQLSRKKALLEATKKGVMQQLFTQTLRFQDDHGHDFPDWEEAEFKEIAAKSSAKYDPAGSESELKCVELESISQGTGELLELFVSTDQKSIKNRFKKGEVLFGKLRPYLRKWLLAPFDGVCSSEIWVMCGRKVTNAFLYHLVQSEQFMREASVSSGSKMPRADWDHLSSSVFAYPPSEAEQTKIASFLSALDGKIGAVGEQMRQTQAWKKGLLQQMFV